jgi:hypothetical protein
MPQKMRVYWDFRVEGHPNFGPGVRWIPDDVVAEALRMGCTPAPDEPAIGDPVGEVVPPESKARTNGSQSDEKAPPTKKADTSKRVAPDNSAYKALRDKAVALGFQVGSTPQKKADLEAYIAVHEKKVEEIGFTNSPSSSFDRIE